MITSSHQSELAGNTKVLVAELQRACRLGEVGRDWVFERLRVRNDCPEVLDSDDDVHAFLHVKVFEVFGVDGDCGLKWLFEDL